MTTDEKLALENEMTELEMSVKTLGVVLSTCYLSDVCANAIDDEVVAHCQRILGLQEQLDQCEADEMNETFASMMREPIGHLYH